MSYDLKVLKAPTLTGLPLRLFVSALESPATGWALTPKLLEDAGVTAFRRTHVDAVPTVRPTLPREATHDGPPPGPVDLDALATAAPPAGHGYRFEDSASFREAYRSGAKTPADVAEAVTSALRDSESRSPKLGALVAWNAEDLQAQAAASTDRWKRGEPLGPLDGVPVAIKDEMDQVPYPTRVGTAFLGAEAARSDSTAVARLRAAGALLIGKAAMHEIGIGVTGLNLHQGTPRNPYAPDHYCGGSSSGSACAVAAGLAPIAVGADGGGSIRTPAAFCGVYGLKATFGRIPEHGVFPLCWSVGHVGPLASTAVDLALAYATLAGPDPRDPNSVAQPAPALRALDAGVKGLRIGLYRPWFEDADPEVVRACERLLDALREAGAEVVEVTLRHLEAARVAQVVSIVSEMAVSMEPYYRAHRKDFGLDVRTNLAIGRLFTSRDYVKAQQVRTLLTEDWNEAMTRADVLVTPTTGLPAPKIRPAALEGGESDLTTLGRIMRFVFAANLNGFPAISIPAGLTKDGLPVGLMAHAPPWEEERLLRLAWTAEGLQERPKPSWSYRLLD